MSHQQSPHYNGSSAISPNDSPRDAEQSVVQERMRKGLVISVLPDGPHGFLADLKFYLNNNHMLLWAFAVSGGPQDLDYAATLTDDERHHRQQQPYPLLLHPTPE